MTKVPNNVATAGDNATTAAKITKDQQEDSSTQASPTAEESSQKVGKKKSMYAHLVQVVLY